MNALATEFSKTEKEKSGAIAEISFLANWKIEERLLEKVGSWEEKSG
jgi:hypothetical protein